MNVLWDTREEIDFGDMLPGETFMHCGDLFMVCKGAPDGEKRAVNLDNGQIVSFANTCTVEKIKAEVHVKNG